MFKNLFKQRFTCSHQRKLYIACCHEVDDFEPWVWAGAHTYFCPDCLWSESPSIQNGKPGEFVALMNEPCSEIISPWFPASIREMLLVYLWNPRV